ncbi:MAG: TonB-dependent receptor, partial [Gammaproteobacteria bacterium]|nr:TonB-dependent receptor [Gammaproteobacteria bacterium]
MNSIARLAALGCAALPVAGAQAETQPAVNLRDNVVITATRTPLSSRRVVAPVDVIDSETIERSMAVELSELLRFEGGLDIVRTGGPGQQTSIFTRGTNSNHTLVLLDGVRLNTGTFGQAAIQNITPDMIERVEIVKAPRTTLYGEKAIGGVINIITKKSERPDVNLHAGGGQDRTVKVGAAGGTASDGFSVNGRVQHIDTQGYPIVEGADFDSGWNNTTVEGKASYVTDRWGLQGRLWLSEGTDEYVAFPVVPASQDYENQVVALAGSVKFTDDWYSVLDLSSTIDEIQQQQSTDFARTELSIADWQNTIDIGAHHVVVAGAYFSNEKVSGISFGSRLRAEETNDVTVYLEDAMQYGRHLLVLAGRLSDSDAIDENFTWNIEYGLDVTPDMRLMASAGRAVRAPSAAERFGAFGGNPRLREEDALTLQAGWGWDFTASQSVSVDLYHTRIDNLIASDANFTLQNIEKA